MRPLLALSIPAAVVAAALSGGCTPLRSHQGYIVDADLANAIQPGVDNRQSVMATLGSPSFASQFNQGDWYYISRDSRNLAFNPPKPKEQLTIRISFDQAGNVTAIRRSGVEQIAAVKPYKKVTPTLGRERGFFAELFGNIGAVGAPGMGGAQGGGRDRP
ncbi:cell envelope protein SmpA [Sphingomonas sp. Leaf412]|uniref:outer membrane protein assembly factor BamE n=1 Tax=Sphingomonas sp. Leaf412 TaxID=1736370 RepID=UPI0006F25CA7|nr:outer membrane protein assembly factor BamE [Sphingomonas sp. Leaf412]KQT34922.1 cell envelope protein SmpA [Sphingomonas sp. Leaf412]